MDSDAVFVPVRSDLCLHQPATGGGGYERRPWRVCGARWREGVCVCETVGDGNSKDGIMAAPASDAPGSELLAA